MAADLACALQQRGDCHNIVVSPANELVSKLRATGAEHRLCFKPNLLNMPAEVLRLRSIISATHPQIIQTYSAESTLLATLACRKLKLAPPICIEVVTAYPRRGISRFFHNGSNAFITISKHLRQVLTDGIFKKRRRDIMMIPYGVNEKQCHPSFRLSADKSAEKLSIKSSSALPFAESMDRCFTPKRCCSSMTMAPRLLKLIPSCTSACVPIAI